MNEPGALEDALRSSLAAAASSVRPEPDGEGLRERIGEDRRREVRRRRRFAVAAAALVGALAGGAAGGALVHGRVAHTVLSDRSGNLSGPLPSGPVNVTPAGPLLPEVPRAVSFSVVYGRAPSFTRTTGSGAVLIAASHYLGPTYVSAGGATGCYGGLLVSTSARLGAFSAGADGVVEMAPLAGDGLEVVDSGAVPVGGGADLWWATVAVGRDVKRVVAEPLDGEADAMRPLGGIALLGGLVPAQEASRFFSVVAEDLGGRSLSSLGFLAGFGSRLRGSGGGGSVRAAGCDRPPAVRGRAPRSPLVAASGVVAAFEQAYGARGAADRLAAVDGLTPPPDPASSPGTARAVRVAAVEFLGPSVAVVVYRLNGGRWQSGGAVRDPFGVWKVARSTYCGDVSSGADAPAAAAGLCSPSGG